LANPPPTRRWVRRVKGNLCGRSMLPGGGIFGRPSLTIGSAAILSRSMAPLDFTRGDATDPTGDGNRIIAHVCNDGGGWGKGFVVAISNRWPDPEREYRRWFSEREGNDFALGELQVVSVSVSTWVANMVAQHGTRPSKDGPPIRYDAVKECLEKLAARALALEASVHMPRIGCGLAGGKWERIEPLIRDSLCARGVHVWVYDFDGGASASS